MSVKLFKEKWVSSIMAFLFVVLGITGVLMLFHVRIPLVSFKFLHILIGVTFVVLGSIHLALNWTKFKSYLKQRSVVIILIAGILVSLSLFRSWPLKKPMKTIVFRGI